MEGARPDVIASVATTPTNFPRPLAFQGDKGTSAASALREIMKFILGTIIGSARSGETIVQLDKPPTGTQFIIDQI